MKNSLKERVDSFDSVVIKRAKRLGHRLERYLIGLLFCWFGLLKLTGETSASSIIAKSVYWWDASTLVPVLGGWELVMGFCLLFRPLVRIAIGLFFIRLPGTFLALIFHWEECFAQSVFIPTIQGQYLLKELTLVGAALIIASTLPPLASKKTQTKSLS